MADDGGRQTEHNQIENAENILDQAAAALFINTQDNQDSGR